MIRILLFLTAHFLLFAGNSFAIESSLDRLQQAEMFLAADDSIGRKVGSYTLIDQDGKRFNLQEYFGKPFIVNFIFTSCTYTCNISSAILADVIEDTGKETGQKVNIITIGFDSERDTHQRMKEYGRHFTEDFRYWRFAAGDGEIIKRLTDEFGFYYQKTKDGFDHTNMISVIDSNGRIYKHIYYGQNSSIKDARKELAGSLNGAVLNAKNAEDSLGFAGIMFSGLKLACSDYDPLTGEYKFNYLYLINFILMTIACFIAPIVIMWRKELSLFFIRLKIFSSKKLRAS